MHTALVSTSKIWFGAARLSIKLWFKIVIRHILGQYLATILSFHVSRQHGHPTPRKASSDNHNNNDKEEEEEDNDNDDDKEEEEDNDNYDEEEDSDNDDNKDKDNKDQERCVCDPCRCPSLFVRLSESSRLSTSV